MRKTISVTNICWIKFKKKTTPNYWITVAHKKKYIFEDIIIFYLTKISYNSGVCAVKLY